MIGTTDIKNHWDRIAKSDKAFNKGGIQIGTVYLDYSGTLKDHNLFNLEVSTLLKYINGGEFICDVGCGRGYTALHLAWKRHVTVLGVDYSSDMINIAEENRNKVQSGLQGTAYFRLQDILDPKLLGRLVAPFDTVITQRCLINISTWEKQKEAIYNISKLLKTDGTFLMLEGSKQGLEKLNQVRGEYHLAEIPVVWHNLFFDDEELGAFASQYFNHITTDNFCSTYMLVSRVIHPALIFPVEPKYEAKINQEATNLPSLGEFGYDKLYVFKKK